jgi:hypothetical protein
MPVYMIEFFHPHAQDGETELLSTRISRAAEELTAHGMGVRVVQAVAFPEDELFQCLLEASSVDAVVELRRQAGLPEDAQPEPVDLLPLPGTAQPQPRGETSCTSAQEPGQ